MPSCRLTLSLPFGPYPSGATGEGASRAEQTAHWVDGAGECLSPLASTHPSRHGQRVASVCGMTTCIASTNDCQARALTVTVSPTRGCGWVLQPPGLVTARACHRQGRIHWMRHFGRPPHRRGRLDAGHHASPAWRLKQQQRGRGRGALKRRAAPARATGPHEGLRTNQHGAQPTHSVHSFPFRAFASDLSACWGVRRRLAQESHRRSHLSG